MRRSKSMSEETMMDKEKVSDDYMEFDNIGALLRCGKVENCGFDDVSKGAEMIGTNFDKFNNLSKNAKENGIRLLENCYFEHCIVTGMDTFDFLDKDTQSYLTKFIISHTTFYYCNFSQTVLRNIRFVDCEFRECSFEESIIESCLFEYCLFADCMFSSNTFNAVHFYGVDFKRTTLRLCEFTKSVWFRNTVFSHSEMMTCTLGMYNSYYEPFEFTACEFCQFKVTKSHFENAKFDSCKIDGITFGMSTVTDCIMDKCYHEDDHGAMSGISLVNNTIFKNNTFKHGVVSISCCYDEPLKQCQFIDVKILETCSFYQFDRCVFTDTLFDSTSIDYFKDCKFYGSVKLIGGTIDKWLETYGLDNLPKIECDNTTSFFIEPNFLFHNRLCEAGNNSEIIKEKYDVTHVTPFFNSFDYPLFYAYLNLETEKVFTFGGSVVEFKLNEYFDALLNKAEEICTERGYEMVCAVVNELKHQRYARTFYNRYYANEESNDNVQEEKSDNEETSD